MRPLSPCAFVSLNSHPGWCRLGCPEVFLAQWTVYIGFYCRADTSESVVNEVQVSSPETAVQRAVQSVLTKIGPSLNLPCVRKIRSSLWILYQYSCVCICRSGVKGKNISLYVHTAHKWIPAFKKSANIVLVL